MADPSVVNCPQCGQERWHGTGACRNCGAPGTKPERQPDPSNGNESQDPSSRHPRKCQARKSNGDQCGRWAIAGGTVCPSHGGRAPQVKAAAARHVESEKAARAAATFGLPVTVEPHAALLDELHRTAGHVAWLGDLIQQVQDPQKLAQYTEAGMRPSVWVEMYQGERKHLAAVATACIKAGIEERRVEIAKQQADMLVSVLRGVLDDLGVSDRPDVNAVVARRLRLVREVAS